MRLHEYQAKRIFLSYDISVPTGYVAFSPDDAWKIALELGPPVVLKAQIHAGGRGLAGGVKIAKTADEAKEVASQILGKNLVTAQTGSQGTMVKRLLVEEAANIDREIYFSIVVDRKTYKPAIIASSAGGMAIEEIAKDHPEQIITEPIEPIVGIMPYQIRRLSNFLGFDNNKKEAAHIFTTLYKIFVEKDCRLVETNPLVLCKNGSLMAIDAKMSIDEDALFRQKEMARLWDITQSDPSELEAQKHKLSFVRLDGNIGCMVNGAGLSMATMDLIKLHGGEPANFLDVGGRATPETIAKGFEIILNDPSVRAILVNIFGGIVRCDRVADGIIKAVQQVNVNVPVAIRLAGTNREEAISILKKAPFKFSVMDNLNEAAKEVVKLVKSA
ncbi:MAG: ADP-forming succinate--CoA ligase subunit beta [Campylobacterota bacterium]|nr:ADP-forming succinate--CoA ligase subunit beta [Campylobacterota bacterium]